MDIVVRIGMFVAVVLLIQGLVAGLRVAGSAESRRVKKWLRAASAGSTEPSVDLLKKKTLSDIPWLNAVLRRFGPIAYLNRLVGQANAGRSPGFFILLSALFISAGCAAGPLLKVPAPAAFAAALLLATLPFVYLGFRKAKRMTRFQEQLPDVLGLIARALKAGHSFPSGLKMVAEEFSDPAGTEFGKVLDEINFGAATEEALRGLAARIDSQDLHFFVISVLIKSETGGNLAEMLEKIADLVRDRFKLMGRVRTLSAEGRISALILVLLPPLVAAYFALVRPEYIGVLFQDRAGMAMLMSAGFLMVAGIIAMRRMVSIKV